MLIAGTHESTSEHRKQTVSVSALQSGDVFVQGKGRLSERQSAGEVTRGGGIFSVALGRVIHHLDHPGYSTVHTKETICSIALRGLAF